MGVHAGLYTQQVPNKGGNLAHKDDVSHTTFAFIAGAAVGVGVMLLFAPQAGSEFRSAVRDYTRQAKDEWDRANDQGGSPLETVLQRGKEWIQRAMPTHATGRERDHRSPERVTGSAPPGGHAAGDTGQDN